MTPEDEASYAQFPLGTYVRVSRSPLDEDGNPPFGQVGDRLAVGGVMVAQAGSGVGIFSPDDLTRVHARDIPEAALADIHRRSGMGPAES